MRRPHKPIPRRGLPEFEHQGSFNDGTRFMLWCTTSEGGRLEVTTFADDEEDARVKADAYLLLHPLGAVYVLECFAYAHRPRTAWESNAAS